MKLIIPFVAGAALLAATAEPVDGRDLESMRLASDLGDVLGSEEPCGLSFDQDAIEAFIDDHVRADDMGFTNYLNAHTRNAVRSVEGMSQSARTAHCRQIRRVALNFGFIEE